MQAEAGLPAERVLIPKALQPIEIKGFRITPFEGLHWELSPETSSGNLKGVPAIAYLVEFNGKRWLFPGDTRTYYANKLPPFGPVDGLFAHLWLGRGCAMLEVPPLLEDFCRFCIDLQPRRVIVVAQSATIVTHLEELGRDAEDYWDEEHFQKVSKRCRETAPDIHMLSARMGESAILSPNITDTKNS